MATSSAARSKSSPATPAPERLPKEVLDEALTEIRHDARQRAATYGKDAIVPEGGE